MSGRPLITCPESYLLSLKSCYAALEHGNPTSECIKEHVAPLFSDHVRSLLEAHSPFCVLSVGSGEGSVDLAFIEMLSKLQRERVGKCQLFQRNVEPDKTVLEVFRSKVEHLPERLQSRPDIEFEWCPITYQEYVERKKTEC